MMATKLRRPSRPNMRRAVILFPSGLTLFNLFFGIFAIITASRGNFRLAGIYVLAGGICDALDGRVARATNAGSQFGEELDSLVDAISFGLAPAMIMYFAVLKPDGWDWIFVFLFAACAVLRLARFNIEQAGTAKTYFSGLPSPAAGCTLASYYWFSQSWLYNYGAIGNLPWQEMLRFLMAALAALMISPIPYPVFPRTGLRSMRALAGTLLLIGSATLLATNRLEFFFPLCLLYVAWGPVRWLLSGIFERRQPTIPYDLSEGEDEEEDEENEEFEPAESQIRAARPGARDTRPPREDRPGNPRVREDSPAPAPRTGERPPRPDRAERPERPQRTEAERAARRDKREKREKREGRPERIPRALRPDLAAETVDVDTMTPADPSHVDIEIAEVTGSIPGAADGAAPMSTTEGAPPRKRKRRRRRGERKERNPADGSTAPDATVSDASSGSDDDGDDDSPYEAESRAPSAAVPPDTQAGHVNTLAPAPAPAPPSPSPTTESHE